MVDGYLVSDAGDGVSTIVTVCETLTKDAPGSLQYCSVSFFLKKKRKRSNIFISTIRIFSRHKHRYARYVVTLSMLPLRKY